MDPQEKYKATREKLFQLAGIAPESKYVRTNGPVEKVHYLHLGSGPPLIIVHGGLSTSSEWINVMGPLSEVYELYVVDRPGHGLSDPIDYRGVDYRESAVSFIRSFMDAVGLEKARLLSNSMGGVFYNLLRDGTSGASGAAGPDRGTGRHESIHSGPTTADGRARLKPSPHVDGRQAEPTRGTDGA